MCNRFGKCAKYVERTSYCMITCVVLLMAALGSLIRLGMVLIDGIESQQMTDLPWDLLAFAVVTGFFGVVMAFVTVHRLR